MRKLVLELHKAGWEVQIIYTFSRTNVYLWVVRLFKRGKARMHSIIHKESYESIQAAFDEAYECYLRRFKEA